VTKRYVRREGDDAYAAVKLTPGGCLEVIWSYGLGWQSIPSFENLDEGMKWLLSDERYKEIDKPSETKA
jgi:hypothetical protein